MDDTPTEFRRIVTGHDDAGNALVVSDSPPPLAQLVGGLGGPTFFEVWNTHETPAMINPQAREPTESSLVLAPPKGGTRLRVIDFPPEGEAIRSLTAAQAAEKFTVSAVCCNSNTSNSGTTCTINAGKW